MNRAEMSDIYDRYFSTVYKVCFLYMKHHADAQDMAQETFCRMLRSPFRYESQEKTKAWLIVTASNLCKNQLKKWWFRNRVTYEEYLCFEETSKEHGSEIGSDVYDAVMALENKYAIPTYLYYYEGYKTGEIAEMLHEKQSTIQTRLAKARELLKLELDRK